MENEIIKNVSIEDFRIFGDRIDYIDDYVVVSNTLENITELNHSEKICANRINFFLIVFCIEGEIEMVINGKNYLLKPNMVVICLPTMILSQVRLGSSYKVRCVGFSSNFMERVMKKEKGSDQLFIKIYNNPILHIEKEQSPVMHHYSALLMSKIKEPPHRYRKDILQYLFAALFCEMINEIQRLINDTEEEPERGFRRAAYVFKHFMAELSKDGGMHRSVSYFANQLCYSPKYVSSVVKQVSGRTALEWIDEYAMEQIKIQLKHSDKSIKEIADNLNFSNQSFFGKYVKAHLGMSPARYRQMPD